MSNSLNDYKYLLNSFGPEKIKERFVLLLESARKFLKDRKIQEYIRIDERIPEKYGY